MATDSQEIRFRGLQGRTLADQMDALKSGYKSMQDYAIDELAKMIHELTQRVERLEQERREDLLDR